jgi:NADH-quinone oxidoreductase subunit C
MSPWEGANYVLPGDEKAAQAPDVPPVAVAKTTESPAQTGVNAKTDAKAAKKVSRGSAAKTGSPGSGEPVPANSNIPAPEAPEPTEARPARAPRKGKSTDTAGATQPKARKPRKPKGEGQ